MSFSSTINFVTSSMTGGDRVMAEDLHSLLELIGNGDFCTVVACTNKKLFVILVNSQSLPLVKTKTDFGRESVVILGGK